MDKTKDLSILFIGNSHTYHHDVPHLVQLRAEAAGYACRVTMLAHPNWFLSQHAEEPEAHFNILYGKYDYVVLQEHAHPFGPEEDFLRASAALNRLIREAGSTPVIYACWAKRDEPDQQDSMNEAHRRIAAAIGALTAPVGEKWLNAETGLPYPERYEEDGAHASRAGAEFASAVIWETILADLHRKEREG